MVDQTRITLYHQLFESEPGKMMNKKDDDKKAL